MYFFNKFHQYVFCFQNFQCDGLPPGERLGGYQENARARHPHEGLQEKQVSVQPLQTAFAAVNNSS